MENNAKEITFSIKNQVEEIARLAEEIEVLVEAWELPMRLSMNINLVLEEALSNIIFYAFEDTSEHTIDIFMALEQSQLEIRITDDGKAFDPTAVQQPDINLPAEERPIGGLGIFLISKIMDVVEYCRDGDRNRLRLTKMVQE